MQTKHPHLGAADTSAYDPTYQAQITCKMAKLQDFVETHLVHLATKQQIPTRNALHDHEWIFQVFTGICQGMLQDLISHDSCHDP